jgi:hypothetical protein
MRAPQRTGFSRLWRFLLTRGLAAAIGLGGAVTLDPRAFADDFQVSYAAGGKDGAGIFMGGTELRLLTAYNGKLYAGNGYWEDRPGSEGPQGAEILVLDSTGARWRVEHSFDERLPDGQRRDFAISALVGVTFATDGAGAPLSKPVSMLIASSWDRTGATRVFSRDDATGNWTATVLSQDPPLPNFLPQIRCFSSHRDRVTGADRVFAGNDPRGVFSGVFDAGTPGRIRWGSTPELDIRALSTTGFPGLGGRLRVSSFAEANGALYAAVGQQVFERIDGREPTWRLLYTNPEPHYSQTGLRGLTAIANPAGQGQVLLAAVEGNDARIVRIDPRSGTESTDLNLAALLNQAWQTRVSYVIAGYNDMTEVVDPRFGRVLVLGLEAFIPPRSPRPPGHTVLDVVHGLEGGAWYLIRHPDGHYDLRQVDATLPEIGRSLVAVRTIRQSPFPGERALYFAGYDANNTLTHNSAWVARASIDAALRP